MELATAAPGRTLTAARVVHPAVRHLPAPGGLGQVAFREAVPEDLGDLWAHGEVRHQTEACHRSGPHGSAVPDLKKPCDSREAASLPSQLAKQAVGTYTKKQLKEWQYPEYDSVFDDPEWLKEQFRKERTDPRENMNFFLSAQDPEFFNNAGRKPYARALIRSEKHWTNRKNMWLEQFESIRLLNESRQSVSDKLEHCSAETKRLVAPLMKYKLADVFLFQMEQRALATGIPFEEQIETRESRRQLLEFHEILAAEGDKGMDDIYWSWDARTSQLLVDEQARREKEAALQGGTVATIAELKAAMDMGAKCKKDGVLEWNKGNHEEAFASWREGHRAMYKLSCPQTHDDEKHMWDELHSALLKNVAQAAIKLGHWHEALEAADLAIKIDDQDHKAWFRKACALEGLGRLGDVEACLVKIDTVAVGRPDGDRILKETQQKRERAQAIRDKDEASQSRMLQRGVRHELFSGEREARQQDLEPRRPAGPPKISDKVEVAAVDEESRKRLTRDRAEDLLIELQTAYADKAFRQQVRKLAQDVSDQGEFICYLNRVALPVQRPVLEKWGFPASDVGVAEMRRAIQDHTRGPHGDQKLRALAEKTTQTLYGDFYQVVRGLDLQPENVAQAQSRRRQQAGREDESENDGDREGSTTVAELSHCLHWTGRPQKPQLVLEQEGLDKTRPKRDPVVELEAKLSRKDIWEAMSKAMAGTDANVLRQITDRSIQAGFSTVTVRSAKKRLLALGGDVSGLP